MKTMMYNANGYRPYEVITAQSWCANTGYLDTVLPRSALRPIDMIRTYFACPTLTSQTNRLMVVATQ